MKLSKKSAGLVIFIITTAMVGLVSVQIFLLNQAYNMKLQTFRQNVNSALNSVVEKLETRETLNRVMKLTLNVSRNDKSQVTALSIGEKNSEDADVLWFRSRRYQPKVQPEGNNIVIQLQQPQRVRLVALDSKPKVTINFKKTVKGSPDEEKGIELLNEIKPSGIHKIPLDPYTSNKVDRYRLFLDNIAYDVFLSGVNIGNITVSPTMDQTRMALIDKVLEQYFIFKQESIKQRIRPEELEPIIRDTLKEKGIRMDYTYGILSTMKDVVVMADREDQKKNIKGSEFRTRLFPHDLNVEPNDLAFYFPGQKVTIIKQLGIPAVFTLIFILLTIGSFIYIMRMVFAQKRFASLTVDFINNMTHEFKTPISTISLASETLTRETVQRDRNRIKKYSHIIQDESLRMRNQVDKILEMAALEKSQLELEISRVDIHALIHKTKNNFALKIENRQGQIFTKLDAGKHHVDGDPVHLLNVIHNLLDNGIKYTREKPKISISTANTGDQLAISVRDNGIGLDPEEQKYIFEKYYRVPTGNVHDVKGFGLGLSYVKLIVKAHRGTIHVKSERDNGSVFEIRLPLSKDFVSPEDKKKITKEHKQD